MRLFTAPYICLLGVCICGKVASLEQGDVDQCTLLQASQLHVAHPQHGEEATAISPGHDNVESAATWLGNKWMPIDGSSMMSPRSRQIMFVPVCTFIVMSACVAMCCFWRAAESEEAKDPITPSLDMPLCPAFVGTEPWRLSFPIAAFEKIDPSGMGLIGQAGVPLLHARARRDDSNIYLDLSVAKLCAPRGTVVLKQSASFADVSATTDVEILRSHGVLYGRLQQVRTGVYHILRDQDVPVLILKECSGASYNQQSREKDLSVTIFDFWSADERKLLASVVQTTDEGRIEVQGQTGADVILIVLSTLALLACQCERTHCIPSAEDAIEGASGQRSQDSMMYF